MDERERMRLTKYSTEAGRAAKFAPGDLDQASEGLTPDSLDGFVGGAETRDAGYVPFGGLLPHTADFFTPVVGDPQASGGLLVAAPEGRARALVRLPRQDGVSAAVVGEVVEGAIVRVTA